MSFLDSSSPAVRRLLDAAARLLDAKTADIKQTTEFRKNSLG